MNKPKTFIYAFIISLCIFTNSIFSKDNSSNRWFFSLDTDIAYYPFSDFIPGTTHFSPITKPLDTAAFRITSFANYLIPLNFGDHFLFENSNIIFQSNVELTPITLTGSEKCIFAPVPFLEIEAGLSYGLGWNFGNVINLYKVNETTSEYEKLSTFKNIYYQYWIKGTFMFDTGALIPGDWTHVVFLADYKLYFQGLTNIPKNTVFSWQTNTGLSKGLSFDSTIVLAYQMPLKLFRAGFLFEFLGCLDSNSYGKYKDSYNADFTTIYISPLLQFKFNHNNLLSIIAEFGKRRSFQEAHNNLKDELKLNAIGSEWFFNKIGASWSYFFN